MPVSIQPSKHLWHADQVFVDVHLMTFTLSGCAAEEVTPDAVCAVPQVGFDDPLTVVPMHDNQGARRKHCQQCSQFGVERGERALVAVTPISVTAELGQDVTVMV